MNAALQIQAPSPKTSTPMPSSTSLLQRKCACGGPSTVTGECVACDKQKFSLQRLMTRSAPVTPTSEGIPQIVHEVLRSPGHPLDAETRKFMEPRFGHNFGDVRVHTDGRAAASASAVNALAYTVGRDVVFGNGGYAPATTSGKSLLAHELTHVVQQSRGLDSSSADRISSPGDHEEIEADRAAEAVSSGQSFHSRLTTGPTVNRAGPADAGGLSGLTATRFAFNNTGTPDLENCAVTLPAALGVDGPRPAQNGMEMIFEISGAIPADTEFEITRTKATGTWERDAAGTWSRLGGDPAGTADDRHDDDECHTPAHNHIFVIDTPGMGSLDPRGLPFPDGTTVAATSTAAVRKHSFAEWVLVRNLPLGIGWTRISSPVFHRWHSIVSVELIGGTWTRVNTPSDQTNEIELGSIGTSGNIP